MSKEIKEQLFLNFRSTSKVGKKRSFMSCVNFFNFLIDALSLVQSGPYIWIYIVNPPHNFILKLGGLDLKTVPGNFVQGNGA